MTILKHQGSTNYYFRFTLNGKVYFGSTKTTNKSLAQKIERAKYDEALKTLELGDKPTISVADALSQYLESEQQAGEYRNIERVVRKMLGSKQSCKDHEQTIHVYGFDAGKAFHLLDDSDVQKLILARRKEGNSNGTILVELVRLSKCINLIKKLGYLAPDIDLKALKTENGVKAGKKQLRYLSPDEEVRLLAELSEKTNHSDVDGERAELKDLVITLLDVGCRYSEAAKLKWDAINLADKTISLYRSKVKNESVLCITDRLYEVLSRRFQNKIGEYVFADSTGTTHRKYTPKGFRNACERAGIEGVSLHGLRKTFTSRLVQAGMTSHAVSKLLGHSTSVLVETTYGHLSPSQVSKGAVDILNKLNK